MKSIILIAFALCITVAIAKDIQEDIEQIHKEVEPQAILEGAELEAIKMKLAEPLRNLRKEYKRARNYFYLNTVRLATKQQLESGALYTIAATLGKPVINCELQLFETGVDYTLNTRCGGLRFKNGIKPITGQRIISS